jgi:hypothetical protein
MKNGMEQEIRGLKKNNDSTQDLNSKQPVEDFKDYNNLPYRRMQKEAESDEEEYERKMKTGIRRPEHEPTLSEEKDESDEEEEERKRKKGKEKATNETNEE